MIKTFQKKNIKNKEIIYLISKNLRNCSCFLFQKGHFLTKRLYIYTYIHIYIYIYTYITHNTHTHTHTYTHTHTHTHIFIYTYIYIHIYTYIYIYIMKCEWLKNESNYFVTCKYFRLILQPLQDCYKCELTSVLAAIYSCSSSHYLTSYFQNMF